MWKLVTFVKPYRKTIKDIALALASLSSTGAMASCDEVSNSDMTEAMESHTCAGQRAANYSVVRGVQAFSIMSLSIYQTCCLICPHVVRV